MARGTRNKYAKVSIAASGGTTTSRDMNVAGLSSAIALMTEIRTDFLAHVNSYGASTGEHKALHTGAVLTKAAPTTLAMLLESVNEMTTMYALHNTDAAATTPTYHIADVGAGNALAAETAITTLNGAITRLNDIKAKLNLHAADATGHRTGASTIITTTNAALGAKILVTNTNVTASMNVSWAILNDGTGNVTGVTAACVNGGVEFTFSADPQDDTIISYRVSA